MRSKFTLHDLVVVTEPIVIESCNTTIEKGARGKIIDIDPDTKDLTLRLYGELPDLHCQRNCILLRANKIRQHLKRERVRDLSRITTPIMGLGVVAFLLLADFVPHLSAGLYGDQKPSAAAVMGVTSAAAVAATPKCVTPVIRKEYKEYIIHKHYDGPIIHTEPVRADDNAVPIDFTNPDAYIAPPQPLVIEEPSPRHHEATHHETKIERPSHLIARHHSHYRRVASHSLNVNPFGSP